MDKDKVKELQSRLQACCEQYVKALHELWDINVSCGEWSEKDNYISLYTVSDIPLTLLDVFYIVNNSIPFDEVNAWNDYNDWAFTMEQHVIGLQQWHKGCRGVPLYVREKLTKMKDDLLKECERLKEQY